MTTVRSNTAPADLVGCASRVWKGVRFTGYAGLRAVFLVTALVTIGATTADAATVTSAKSAMVTSTFISAYGNDYGIDNTLDQSGLSQKYVSGVTDFDDFVGQGVTHTTTGSGNEWFSRDGKNRNISVTYDLGSVLKVDRMALWNEEFAGVDKVRLMGSADGVNFSLLSLLIAEDNAYVEKGKTSTYGAQIFGFLAASLRFIRMDIGNCSGPPSGVEKYRGCGIGEVAFSTQQIIPPVPLPTALPLLLTGLVMCGIFGRLRKSRP